MTTAYIIERTTDFGHTELYLNGREWVANAKDAERMTWDEATQLADDFGDHAAMKGNGYLFNVGEVEDAASISLVPSWEVAASIYVTAVQNGTREGVQSGLEGLRDMGERMDKMARYIKVLEANQ